MFSGPSKADLDSRRVNTSEGTIAPSTCICHFGMLGIR